MTVLQKSREKTILPFAVSPQKNKSLNENVEKAAVFCTIELNRQRGRGFFRKQDNEKIVFISKVLYPFWITPLRESTLLIDGLNLSKHIITYPDLPDIKAFIENLKGHSTTRQLHANFLSNNQNYFQTSNNEVKLSIEGLLNDSEFTEEFLDYTKHATTTNVPITENVLVSPCLDKDGILKMLQNIENTRLKLSEDKESFNEVIKLLNSKNNESKSGLNKEIKAIEAKYRAKIQKAKRILENKVSKINKTYSNDVTVTSNKFEQKIKVLHKNLVKFEKEKEKLDTKIEQIESEIKTSAINKDNFAEQKWKEKRNELKDKRPEINLKLKEMQKQIDEVEETRMNKLFVFKRDNEAKIKEAGKDLLEIECSRDAEIKVYQNEIEKIDGLTSSVIEKVNELAKNMEGKMLEFDQLGIRQKRTDYSLVYMPFYLSCYQSKLNKRYSYLAPSELSDGGLSTRLKAFGKTKISQIFQTKNKKITPILNSFIGLMDVNIVFNCDISEACMKANLLQSEKIQESIKRGLDNLKEQGWLSNSEFDEFNQAIEEYLSN